MVFTVRLGRTTEGEKQALPRKQHRVSLRGLQIFYTKLWLSVLFFCSPCALLPCLPCFANPRSFAFPSSAPTQHPEYNWHPEYNNWFPSRPTKLTAPKPLAKLSPTPLSATYLLKVEIKKGWMGFF